MQNRLLCRTILLQKQEIEDLKECLIKNQIQGNIPSTEENIYDVIELANSQIKIKNKEIKELKEIIFKPSIKTFKDLPTSRLEELQKFYKETLLQIESLIDYN